MRWIRNLSELTGGDLPLAGGKAANLGVMIRGGMPVPPGFCITTGAYREFVLRNDLGKEIEAILKTIDRVEPEPLESAAKKIRAWFLSGRMPQEIAEEIRAAYRALDSGADAAVAVRSSATAEDLPEMSFAGQQETFLNVIGGDPLLQSAVECWASLWTARAIGYRMRNAVPVEGLALAVVVQRMIPSEASGVLFTANPLSGSRRETVIDATFGLGEALVGGKVEPDHYVVRMPDEQILSKQLGAKAFQIRARPGGGTESSEHDSQSRQALDDGQILELARLGGRARALFADPQDIEWALAEGKFHLVQSRPITSLFPVPEGFPDGKLRLFFSFAAVQGMQDPMTPLGQDSLKMIVSVAARLFGVRTTSESQTVFYIAGERIWMNFTPILKNSSGRRAVPVITALVEPAIGQAVQQLRDDPELQPGRAGISPTALFRLGRFFAPLGFNILRNLISPRARREYIVAGGERLLEEMEARCATITGDRYQRLDKVINLLPDLAAGNLPYTFLRFVSGVAAGMVSWNVLNILARKAMEDPADRAEVQDLVLSVTRGMPYNPTTEMDLALWDMAKAIRRDPESRAAVQGGQAAELARMYREGVLPAPVMRAAERFLRKYGGRGFGEIDLGRTRWAEDPTHVFEMLINFLQIEDEARAPDAVFARSAASAEDSVGRLATAVGKTRGGWIKARLVRFFAGRARQLMGARESPKFFAVRMMYLIHRELLKLGREFVSVGELAREDDLFYLTISEIRAFAARENRDWRGMVAGRRTVYQRELRRRQIPRLLLSDGRAFYEGIAAHEGDSENRISGSPVSPGVAEGRVHVVLDPRRANLQPGEILVCPGTDPSWTPLFLSAGALVMETGGMMTHGSVVAREYGIPGVVGVHAATTRLKTGQRVRVDGSRGIVEVLE
ncbi:MAG: PEP/pyruvate-binding domain-containing protein [Anaerolineales bacterium]